MPVSAHCCDRVRVGPYLIDYEKRLATDKLDVKLSAFAAEAGASDNFTTQKELATTLDADTDTLQVPESVQYPALRNHLAAGTEWPPCWPELDRLDAKLKADLEKEGHTYISNRGQTKQRELQRLDLFFTILTPESG